MKVVPADKKYKFNNVAFRKGVTKIVTVGGTVFLGIVTLGNVAFASNADIDKFFADKDNSLGSSAVSFEPIPDISSEFKSKISWQSDDLVYNLVTDGTLTEDEFNALLSFRSKDYFFMKDLESMRSVHIETPIKNLEFLKYVPNLEDVIITECEDFSYLSKLNIKQVILENSNFTNDDFNYLPKTVEQIQIREGCDNITEIPDLNDICPKLKAFSSKGNKFAKIVGLPKTVEILTVKDNENIQYFGYISNMCPNIKNLDLYGCNNLKSIHFVKELKNLERVSLSCDNEFIANYVEANGISSNLYSSNELIDNNDMIYKAMEDGIENKIYQDNDLIYDKGIFPESVLDNLSEITQQYINQITFDDLKYIDEFTVTEMGVDNLDFLYYMPNVTRLNIRGVNDISALKYTKVKELYIQYGGYIDEDLENLPNTLELLGMSDSMYITDLSVLLEKGGALKTLFINNCTGIKNLDFLSGLPNLQQFQANDLACVTNDYITYLNNNGIKHNLNEQDVLNNYKIDEILSTIIHDGMSQQEQVNAIMNYVVQMEYCFDEEKGMDQNSPLTYALTEGKAVCKGYATLASVLMQRAGLEAYCFTVANSYGGINHAINVMKIGNKWVVGEPQYGENYQMELDELKEYYEQFIIPDEILEELYRNQEFDKLIYPASAAIGLGVLAGVGIAGMRIKKKKQKERIDEDDINMSL